MLINKVDHIGICVNSIEQALKLYQSLFYLKPVHIESIELHSARIAFIPVGEIMVELIEPLHAGKGGIAEFLAKSGEGIHHIAYRVEDIDEFILKMKQNNIKLITDSPQPGGADSRIVVLDRAETGNILTEIVERKNGWSLGR